MDRFGKRFWLHTVRTLTGPLMAPGLLAAWLANGRLVNAAIGARLKARAAAGQPPTPRTLTLAVVADTHYDFDGATDLHRAVHAMQPDGILHLGDYANEGGLFELLRHLSNWDLLHQQTHAGMLHVIGNHDKRTFGRFWFERLFGPVRQTLDLGGWRIVILNNTEKREAFAHDDVAFLTALAANPKPTLLTFHKPPLCDRWPHHTANDHVPELFRAARAAGVQLALCGHCHVYDETEIEAVRVILTGGGGMPAPGLGFGTLGRHLLKLELPTEPNEPIRVHKVDLAAPADDQTKPM